MRVQRLGVPRVVLTVGALLGLATVGGATATAGVRPAAPARQAAAAPNAFMLNIYPAYTTAGLKTTFEVTVANTSSQRITLRSVKVSPPAGFTVAHPSPNAPFRRKTLVTKRTQTVRQLSLRPGQKMEFAVVATAPTKCGTRTLLHWTSHAFQGAASTGPQLVLQPSASAVGVTVVCPQIAPCGDGGPACSTDVNTSISTYGVVSNAAVGTLNGTLDVGTRLKCGAYPFHDPNWYDSVVTPPTTGPPAAATAPIVDVVSYTVKDTTLKGIGFCLGATYEFVTASGNQAPAGTLPNGNAGFIGLLPMCTPASPPCISSVAQRSDPKARTGHDAVLRVQIPEQGDPWGGS